jgi:hypothetical protein
MTASSVTGTGPGSAETPAHLNYNLDNIIKVYVNDNGTFLPCVELVGDKWVLRTSPSSLVSSGPIIISGSSVQCDTDGNPRGFKAYDFQCCRTLPTQVASGDFSFIAGGCANTASGLRSHAEGYLTIANGESSHAEGRFSQATGTNSHAEGRQTTASGNYSHAEGYVTIASGSEGSHAEGNYSHAITNAAHAEGSFTTASGFAAHSEGSATQASGSGSHSEGQSTQALGFAAHSEGSATQASGLGSHSEGYITTASGPGSHAEGSYTIASGSHSHAEGEITLASNFAAHAEGHVTQASGIWSHAEGDFTIASGSRSHAEGFTTTASGFVAHAEGQQTTASGPRSHAEGLYSIASGYNSHAEGHTATASGYASHAGGGHSLASQISQWARASNRFVAAGDAQMTNINLMKQTTTAASTRMTIQGAAGPQFAIAVGKAYACVLQVIAKSAADKACFRRYFLIDNLAGTTSMTGAVETIGTDKASAGAATWAIAVTADNALDTLAVDVTGAVGTTIRWVARLETTEVLI